jgi:hypothetical protein
MLIANGDNRGLQNGALLVLLFSPCGLQGTGQEPRSDFADAAPFCRCGQDPVGNGTAISLKFHRGSRSSFASGSLGPKSSRSVALQSGWAH